MNTNNKPSLLSFSVEAILAGPGPRTKRFKPDCDSEDGGSEQHLVNLNQDGSNLKSLVSDEDE